MLNNKSAGILFEETIAKKLIENNFTHVKVTKASHDYGADILAFKNGLEYVVQCKKYKTTVGFDGVKDLSTAMDIYQADKGILVCDTAFSRNAIRAVKTIDKPIELITFGEILRWKTPRVPQPPPKPFPYQKRILKKLAQHRQEGNKSALVVMATGLGKTLVAAWDLKSQLGKRGKALFLVHRKDILVDNAEKFYNILNQDGENFKFGIYFGGKKFQKEDIIFSTFQTIIKYHKNIPCQYFDYIIIDEAHHSPAATYSQIISYFQPRFILGITATPRRITRQENNFIEKVFGKPLIDLDLAGALVRGYLSPVRYSVLCDNIDYEKLKSVNRKLSIEQLNQKYFIPTKDEDIEKIVLKELEKIKTPRTIIFCPNIKYINSIKSIGLFKNAEVYHSRMDDFSRNIIFRRFKLGKISALLVVDLFNEGIDVPEANLVVFLRTTYSPTIFFQQLGRGLRRTAGKKYLRVLDFVGVLKHMKKTVNAFGHLLIVKDFVEKVEKQRKVVFSKKAKRYVDTGMLDPLDLDFYQAGRRVKHNEIEFAKKDFLEEIKFIKKNLIKSEGWTEEEIIDELKPICERLGYFPSEGYLQRIGRTDLAIQITNWGGVYHFARILGVENLRKERGYWSRFSNLKKELLPICKRLKSFPTITYLFDMKRADITLGIRMHGGVHAVAEKLGYPIKRYIQRGSYDSFSVVKKEIKKICKKIKKFPTIAYLKSIDKLGLALAIQRKHGGAAKIAIQLGYKPPRLNTLDIWTWRRLKKEIMILARKNHGKFPNSSYLNKIGRLDISYAIIRKFDGFSRVKTKLGFEKEVVTMKGYWRKWRNLRREILDIFRKTNRFPSQKVLTKLGKSGAIRAIQLRGGPFEVAQKLKIPFLQRKRGVYSKFEDLKKVLAPLCEKLGHFPSIGELKKGNKMFLYSFIVKHGGSYKVADKMGYAVKRYPEGYLQGWNNFRKEIMQLIAKLGHFPSRDDLVKSNKLGLMRAINKYHGGIFEVRKRLGFQPVQHQKGYGKNWNNIRKELVLTALKIRKIPSSQDLKREKKGWLYASINRYHGKYNKVIEELQREHAFDSIKIS